MGPASEVDGVRVRVAAADAAWRQVAEACGVRVEQCESQLDAADSEPYWLVAMDDTAAEPSKQSAQSIGAACLLQWILQRETSGHADVQVQIPLDDSKSEGGEWVPLVDVIGGIQCDDQGERLPTRGVRVLETAATIEALESGKVQIVDSRRTAEFHGWDPLAPVSGHLAGAISVPFQSVFEEDSIEFLSQDGLVELMQGAGVDFEAEVMVISTSVKEAAAVATAALLAGHPAVSFSIVALTDAFVASLPSATRASVYQQDELVFATVFGEFDVSPDAPSPTEEELECGSQAKREYEERLDAAKNSKPSESETTQDSDDDAEEIVWTDEDGHRFFDVPSPVDKPYFLQISREIYAMASFVLAPFGFPSLLQERFSKSEVRTRCSALYHDVIEVCSDLVYRHHDLNEGVMARSVHKWVDEQQDAECTQQVRSINDLLDTLYQLPTVVEVPAAYDEERVLGIADDLFRRMGDAVRAHAAWAFDAAEEQPADGNEDSMEANLPSWPTMYPSVVYTLGFIPREPSRRKLRLSTLQIKAFIQTIAEAIWDVMGALSLSEIEFQALCEVLSRDGQSRILELKAAAEQALYVVNHSLSHQTVEEADDALEDHLLLVRIAKSNGDREVRAGRYKDALECYSETLPKLPLFHKEVASLLVGRANCFLHLNDPERARIQAMVALRIDSFCCDAYSCLGDVAEKQMHPTEAMQNHITAFVLDGSRSPEHATAIERVGRLVGRESARSIFDAMVLRHELPAAWLSDSYFDSFEHDVDSTVCVPITTDKTLTAEANALSAEQLVYRAIAFKRKRQYSDAQRDVETALSRHQELENDDLHAIALNLHASFLYVAGDVHGALTVIDEALALRPTSVNALVKKGGFLSETGDVDAADACFAEALEVDANDSDIHLHMGQKELVDGNYHEAVQCLRRAISRSEALPVTHVSYGMALYRGGSIYQALDVFRDAERTFPDAAEVHLFYGEVLSDQGDFAGAMQHFLRALELSPQCPLAFLNAGRVYVSTNDPARAITHFERALRVDPRCSSAHLDIAQVLFAQGRVADAFRHFDAAAECCRFLPEVEEACAAREMARMQERVTDILGVDLRHVMKPHA